MYGRRQGVQVEQLEGRVAHVTPCDRGGATRPSVHRALVGEGTVPPGNRGRGRASRAHEMGAEGAHCPPARLSRMASEDQVHPGESAREAAVVIVRVLRHAGHVAYFAGGCVRDELLGLHPKDYDVATSATPDEVRALFRRTQAVGASFGVVLVRERDWTVEVATFRRDGPYSDARRPDTIEFADPVRDAQRRDFTINAIFLDPLDVEAGSRDGTEAPGTAISELSDLSPMDQSPVGARTGRGRIIDFVGGVGDLRARIIRAVGDPHERLREDHLRALRAVRFASRLGFTIEEGTAEAVRAHARELRGVSRERIGDEIRRMITHPSRAVAAWTLQYLGLDEPVLGAHTTRAPKILGRLDDRVRYPTCLAAWAVDRGSILESTQVAGLVASWRDSLCLTNDERDEFRAVLLGMGALQDEWWMMGVAAQKRAAGEPWFGESLRLVAAHNPESMVRIQRRVFALAETPSGIRPDALLGGDDLIAMGLSPGPRFQEILRAVYDAQLEDRVSDREGAIGLAMELAKSPGVQ